MIFAWAVVEDYKELEDENAYVSILLALVVYRRVMADTCESVILFCPFYSILFVYCLPLPNA